ncbi:Bro-N domain-containing protein [Candidatus Woesearchaeota archaeon]|nr:Bro-N domain-containing protein [Candidatus Woesearchaeota archaeon]
MKIKQFENKQVRVIWYENKWYFSIVDVVEVLTESTIPKRYWADLKIKLKAEGFEAYENIIQLKLIAEDGKMRETDVADTEQLFRLIQSIPSKKAEPFKMWLAKVGKERIDEASNPELAIDRAFKNYLKKGFSKEWINQRLKTIDIRKELTEEWKRIGIKEASDFAILTNEVTNAWSGLNIKEYKKLKNLKTENLRDNMNNAEIVLNMLAEVATKEISIKENPKKFEESKKIARKGGKITGKAKKELEKEIGKSIIN